MIYLFPGLVAAIVAAFLYVQTSRRHGRPQYLDIGLAFIGVIAIYGFFPGLGFLLEHVGIGQVREDRLGGGLDIGRIETIQVIFLCYLASFAVTYSLVRRYSQVRFDSRVVSTSESWLFVGVSSALILGIPLAKMALGIESSEEYIGTYSELRSLPLLLQQLFGVATQLLFATLICAIVFFVARQPRNHLMVGAFALGYVAYAVLAGGMRAYAFLAFFAYLVAASIYVRGVSLRTIAVAAVPALALFLAAGLLRQENSDWSYLDFLQSGEFVALFVNSIDLHDRFELGEVTEIRFAFYLVDFIRLLPAQLFGGEKIDPATWYVETFYPSYHDAGGGLAFGVIAESVVGFGAPEAAMRGALTAAVFALAANHLMNGTTSPTRVFVYVWLVVSSYHSFRDTTLSIATRAVYQVLPILAILTTFRWLTRPAAHREDARPT